MKRIPCRCEQCHRISWELTEPKNPDWWFCAECRGEPKPFVVNEWEAERDR